MRSRVVGLTAAALVTVLGAAGLGVPAAAAARAPAKAFDFNGDGFRDLALGSPRGGVSGKRAAGFVSVVYGSRGGLNTGKRQVLSQNSPGVPGAAEAGDNFGASLTSADLNRDGYAELAIGAPGEDTGKGADAGTVTVLWGTRTGLTTLATADEEFGGAGKGHRWGDSLVATDIERDGWSELFITVPGTGRLKWFYYRPTRAAGTLTGRPGGSVGIPGSRTRTKAAAPPNKLWLAAGDVTGDRRNDVVLGFNFPGDPAPQRRMGFVVYPGISQTKLDFDKTSLAFASLGSMAVGGLDGDKYADVVLGQPGHNGGKGQVTVFKGSATGVKEDNKASLDQETAGVSGVGVSGDRFGVSVSVGDANKDGRNDLAVGSEGEDLGAATNTGGVYVLFGSATGMTGAGSQWLTQNSPGVPDTAERGDHFGSQVLLRDHNNDGYADLVVGVPTENGANGAVTFLRGRAAGVRPASGAVVINPALLKVTGRAAELGRVLGR